MKKILYVTTVSGTINAFLIPHIKMLIEQGNEVDVACNISKKINLELDELGCKIHNIEFQRSPLKKDNIIAYRKIKKIVVDEKYDLIHTHTPIASFITRIACRNIENIKVFYTVHGFHFFRGAPLKNWFIYYPMEKLTARWTDVFITMNSEDYLCAKKMNSRKKTAVYKINGVGIDLSEFSKPSDEEKIELRKKYKYNDEDFILFYAAELNQNKHQDLLINSIEMLKEEIPNIKLLLAGRGASEKKYKQLVNQLELCENIEFLGFRRDISDLLTSSDIAVASSKREGLPVNVMEAMAKGLPLVVTDVRGHRDLVVNDKNGYVVETNDISAFSNAVENIFNSDRLKNEFSEKSLELIRKYSIDNVLKEILEIYNYYL